MTDIYVKQKELSISAALVSGIHELSSECLFVLSQEQNLKSVMLLSACRNGMLPVSYI